MVVIAERVGVRWTRCLLNTCMKEGRGGDPRGVTDLVDSVCLE